MPQKATKFLGYYCKKNFCQELSKLPNLVTLQFTSKAVDRFEHLQLKVA